jgi:uncharacterized protein YxjI
MNYPLDLSFKIIAIAPQIAVRDAAGALVLYVKQKAFKLKEDVTVYADENQTRPVFRIAADRIIDFNARYEITTAGGDKLGAIKRQGMRSLWKSHYDVSDARGANVFTIREANPWTKVFDNLLGEIPVLGILTGYLFHPAYVVSRPNGTPMFKATKRAALFEGKYRVTVEGKYTPEEEAVAMPAILMMLLLERMRG